MNRPGSFRKVPICYIIYPIHHAEINMFTVGSKVKNLKPGDRVALEPGATCRTCEACKSGKYEVRLVSFLNKNHR